MSPKTIILAGGSGTRLFPLSRGQYPKQFIPLIGGVSLFQKTLERALMLSRPDEVYVVTNRTHRFLVSDQACEGCHILVEPEGRNTLPAIYYGISAIVDDWGPSDVVVLPSDHLVDADAEYIGAMEAAVALAPEHLVTFGVTPDSPQTGYGYIRPGEARGGGFLVDAFVEKPDAETAERYLSEGYLWNAGIFLFSSDLFLSECARVAPEVVEAFQSGPEEAFASVPAISVDYGIMEKTSCAAVVPLSSSWSDLGSFDALYSVLEKDDNQNAVHGEHIPVSSDGNLIISKRLVATIGLHDMAVIDTRDALLVCPRAESQHVGEITRMLKSAGDERAEFHKRVHRPWGSYTELEADERYKIKRLSVPPGKRLSLQMHHHRSEHWVVVKGTAGVSIGGESSLVRQGESTFVPAGVQHRLENPGVIPLEMIEVQIGEYVGEDDIVRFEDDYGRPPANTSSHSTIRSEARPPPKS